MGRRGSMSLNLRSVSREVPAWQNLYAEGDLACFGAREPIAAVGGVRRAMLSRLLLLPTDPLRTEPSPPAGCISGVKERLAWRAPGC